MEKKANAEVAGKPVPRDVRNAIDKVSEYIRAGGWAECIISETGGAAFRLESLYDQYFDALRESNAPETEAAQE